MRIQKQEKNQVQRSSFTLEEIVALYEELKGDFTPDTREKWLISKGAIKSKETYVKGVKIHEIFVCPQSDGTFIYTDLSELWDQAKRHAVSKEVPSPDDDIKFEELKLKVKACLAKSMV